MTAPPAPPAPPAATLAFAASWLAAGLLFGVHLAAAVGAWVRGRELVALIAWCTSDGDDCGAAGDAPEVFTTLIGLSLAMGVVASAVLMGLFAARGRAPWLGVGIGLIVSVGVGVAWTLVLLLPL